MQGCSDYVAGPGILQEGHDTQAICSYPWLDRKGDLFIDWIVTADRVHLRKILHYGHMSQSPARVLAARYLGFRLVVSQGQI